MLDLIICSFFKDSQIWGGRQINQIERYFHQIESQDFLKDKNYKIFAIEGNSKDNTREVLESYKDKFPLEIIDDGISLNSPVQSTASEDRLKTLNDLGNLMLDNVKGKAYNYLWLESDIIIPKHLFAQLNEGLSVADIIAPVITWQTQDTFYDLWAFIDKNGKQWGTESHNEQEEGRYIPMLSIGSSALINGKIINSGINFGSNCFRGLCENSVKAGYKIVVDSDLRILHPSIKYINGRMV